MNRSLCFAVSKPNVIWELIERDIIAINLDNGYYYDISGLSAPIWLMIENGLNYEDILKAVALHYQKTVQEVTPDVNFFLCTLEEESLIVRLDSPVDCSPSHAHSIDMAHLSYHRPELKKYTDMENLLLIDPIHEVDEHGWPNRYPLPATEDLNG